ncbi:MAG: hypothetical protein ABFS17_06515 [Chloroflexota bacterium]
MPLNIVYILIGVFITGLTLLSATRTFVSPRAESDKLTEFIFRFFRMVFQTAARLFPKYRQKDRIMAFYAPVVLLSLPPVWLLLISIGFTFIYYGLGISNWSQAFILSGSSLLTLGFAKSEYLFPVLEFTQATLGPLLIALLISYLPTMYAAYQYREKAVNLLTVRAGSPPSPLQMLMRFHRLNQLDHLSTFWEQWENWFVELEHSHTSFSALVYFRSLQPEHSWVNSAAAILDAAALRLAVLDLSSDLRPHRLPDGSETPSDPQAAITIRAGFIALRRIADLFKVEYNADPNFPADPISITRAQFDLAISSLQDQGIPLQGDLEKAWQDFAGWRVNYDSVLEALLNLTMAPPSSWVGFNDLPNA